MEFDRLENLIVALTGAPPEHFTMAHYCWGGHEGEPPCGTPACVLGWYASRRDLQDAYYIDRGDLCAFREAGFGGASMSTGYITQEHFGLSASQCEELFSGAGCGSAQTPDDAIAFIRAFIDRHRAAAKVVADFVARSLADE